LSVRGAFARVALGALAAVAAGLAAPGPAFASTWPVVLGTGVGEARGASPPAAPANPAAACVSTTSTQIKVSWSAVARATTYSVYESTTSATGSYSVAATGVTGTTWTSGSLGLGNYWFEAVALIGSNWQSAQSAATSETTLLAIVCTQP
jgi:hypothetical protein